MSNKFWSRKSSKFYVVSKSPSVNWTKIGKDTVPIPYPVSVTLDNANNYSEDVFTDGCNVYHSGSDTSLVFGDEAGTKGGVKSGTVSEKSKPIFADCSPTVFINGNRLSRSEDMQEMQGANTIGTIMTTEFGESKDITDTGEFDYGFPDDMDESDVQDTYSTS
jgi:hypothetical protein